MKKTAKEDINTTEVTEQEELKSTMKIATSDQCYFRKICSMKSDACVRKAKAGTVYEIEQVITNLGVKYFKLTNGYYISSLEAHTLYGEESSNEY